MRKLKVLGILLGVFLVCAGAHAATPYETRTAWIGGTFWVDGATGNTIICPRGEGYFNAVWIKNDCDNPGGSNTASNCVYINWNGAATESTATEQNPKAPRYDTRNPVSATTSDFLLKAGEEIWLNPFNTGRIEVTGNTADPTGGYIRFLGLYAD